MARTPYQSTDSHKRTFVFLEVDGETFDWWTDYQIQDHLLGGASSFSFHAPALPREIEGYTGRLVDLDARGIRRGMQVKIYVKTPQVERPVLQRTARIDDVDISEDHKGGATVAISGRDHLAPIVDSDMLPSLALETITYSDLVRRVLTQTAPGQPAPFFKPSDVVIDNNANRVLMTGKPGAFAQLSTDAPQKLETLKLDQVKPHPGETVFAFLSRHAVRFGLIIWGTADGKILFGRPNYDQRPIARLALRQGPAGIDNTVVSLHRHTSFKHRPSEVHVYGNSRGGDHMKSAIHAVAYDDEVRAAGLWRTLTIHDNNARDKAQAEHRAQYELSRRRQTGDVIQAQLAGHANADGAVYAIDTVVSMAWDKAGVFDDRYVVGRTFMRNREGGTRTALEIVPKNSIALGTAE